MKTRFAITLALLATISFGQNLQVTVSPNPAPLGSPINVTVNDAFGIGLFTPGNAGILSEVRSGSPAGPTVAIFGNTLLPGAIPPCGSPPRSQMWTPSATVTAGDYWIGITYSVGMFGAFQNEWFSVSIEDPMTPKPALSPSMGSTPTVGTTYLMDIAAPNHPMDVFIMAMSASTNVGLPLGSGIHFALDIDPVFNLSFPNPTPLLFQNFQGNLDLNGAAVAALLIPNSPSIACIPLHCQALIIPTPGASTVVEATNCHTFYLQ